MIAVRIMKGAITDSIDNLERSIQKMKPEILRILRGMKKRVMKE